MKFFVSFFTIACIAIAVYLLLPKQHEGKKLKTTSRGKDLGITAFVVFLLLSFLAFQMYNASMTPDAQCTTSHVAVSKPPSRLVTALDYFNQGNYDYETGDCARAIVDYTISVRKDPTYRAYNNRAYTYMREQDYAPALADLNQALAIDPIYIQALMNRGDIHNFYYQINRVAAIADYETVIRLGGTKGTSVCGHLFMAVHNGWNLATIMNFPWAMFNGCH